MRKKMCYIKIFSRIKYFFIDKILFDTIDDVQKMILENIAFERRCIFCVKLVNLQGNLFRARRTF